MSNHRAGDQIGGQIRHAKCIVEQLLMQFVYQNKFLFFLSIKTFSIKK
jgi:hypothetical protein